MSSVLYKVSNMDFEQRAVFVFSDVVAAFKKGPNEATAFLAELWENARAGLKKQGRVDDIVDIDREVKPEDFRVTFRQIPDKADVFFVLFPEVENTSEYMAACKCLAFVLAKDRPRFLTMEYSQSMSEEGQKPCFVFGEWVFDYLNGSFRHLNYGKMERDTIEHFATIVEDKLKAQ